MNNSTEEELLICKECKGTGEIKHKELEDYHNHLYRIWFTTCTKCLGSGRMIKTTTVTYTPYCEHVTALKEDSKYFCSTCGEDVTYQKDKYTEGGG